MRVRRIEGRLPRRSAPQPERAAAFRLGISAESRAATYLMAKGYRIVARRWKSSVGEIDIIARRGRTLVFVEVKARERFDDAAECFTTRQQRRVAAAAAAWLAEHPEEAGCDIRFDAVLVTPGRLPRHIPAAFESEI
jgi:putative endonuclease